MIVRGLSRSRGAPEIEEHSIVEQILPPDFCRLPPAHS
jgi:hypothetical protein